MSGRGSLSHRLSPALLALAAAAAVLAIGLTAIYLIGSGEAGSSGTQPGQTQSDTTGSGAISMPDWVMAAPEDVRMAYQFAADRPDVLMWMPCYCGCGGHSGHKSAKNCFVQESSTPGNVQFDEHGAGCQMCVEIALDTKAMTEEGRSLREIRSYIDDKFGDIGPGTNTPMPPG